MKKILKGWLMISILYLPLLQGCQYGSDGTSDFSSGEGRGGSMARFTVSGDHLFTVDPYYLKVFDLSDPKKPEFLMKRQIGNDIETIFPLRNNLFLGTTTGMYIYDVTIPSNPRKVSFYEHIYACDPVVSDGEYAYVTLRSSNLRCWRTVDELQVVNIRNLSAPQLVGQFAMASPRGLAIRNDTLWVCDEGIKVLDVHNKEQIRQLYHFSGFPAYDIILNGRLALVTGENGFVQYRIENGNISKLSEIKINE